MGEDYKAALKPVELEPIAGHQPKTASTKTNFDFMAIVDSLTRFATLPARTFMESWQRDQQKMCVASLYPYRPAFEALDKSSKTMEKNSALLQAALAACKTAK